MPTKVSSVQLLTGTDLDAAAGHLFYEIKMTGALYGWTLEFELNGPAVLKNACLEATLVHLRVLIEFLSGRVRSGNRNWSSQDIQPSHFTASWTPQVRLDRYLELADKHVAHMSLERVKSSAPRNWALARMVDEVLQEMERFAASLTTDEISQVAIGVRAAVAQARYLISAPPESWPPELPTQLPIGSGMVGATTNIAAATVVTSSSEFRTSRATGRQRGRS